MYHKDESGKITQITKPVIENFKDSKKDKNSYTIYYILGGIALLILIGLYFYFKKPHSYPSGMGNIGNSDTISSKLEGSRRYMSNSNPDLI